jgi:hypothetical protein
MTDAAIATLRDSARPSIGMVRPLSAGILDVGGCSTMTQAADRHRDADVPGVTSLGGS